MKKAFFVLLLLAAPSAGCRLSDPFYALKEIHADEPEEEGTSLIFGTIYVDQTGAGDLNTVNFERIGPEGTRTNWGVNRVNLFRVFSRRAMKDGNFLMEVGPGLYEMTGFSTSGWGQAQTWNAKDEVRKNLRILVTRPGIYDLGSIRVAHDTGCAYNSYGMERTADASPQRLTVLRNAIAGTAWERVFARAQAASPPEPAAPPSPATP